ncbi:MAG: 50S ribosomal protein L10 [Rhizobiales bacterium]|nr:50S ribosomal protein L10 [Hyphomicrobiales bacterium]NRB13717.1 50S ribosomal protein L10 [Hyphomicrobiales bacterium]
MDRAQKEKLIATLHDVFSTKAVCVVAHYKGLSVKQMTDLRRRSTAAGATVKVAKNRLVKLALKGTDMEGISDLFVGQTVISYADDVIAAPKVAAAFAKDNEDFVILGGAMGTTILDEKGVKSLASMPSLDELRGKLVGLINAPATKIAGVLAAPGGQVARVIGAYADKG